MNKIFSLCFVLLLCACSKKESQMRSPADMSAARANLAFTCVHEADHLPPFDPDANELFLYARYLEKIDGPKDFNDVARYYRIAAAHGHYKANNNLQLLVSEGFASSPGRAAEVIDLANLLIKAGVPGGYYDMGHYLEWGYGVKRDADKARRYFRKAADLGSPEAQYYVGDLLSARDKAPDVSRQMLQCAADQGYGKAGSYLGIDLSTIGRYPEAVAAFQAGVAAGDSLSALALEKGFTGPPSTDRLNYLALADDPERSSRYRLIGKFLRANETRNPKVPDIDKIVPLPPAKLPPWDGTFRWEKEQAAAMPPEKPSEELIDRMAKAKQLDPVTGLPLAAAQDHTFRHEEPTNVAERLPLGSVAYSGDVCPEDGVWCANLGARKADNAERRLTKGDVFPQLVIQTPRRFGLFDRSAERSNATERVVWQLTDYNDLA